MKNENKQLIIEKTYLIDYIITSAVTSAMFLLPACIFLMHGMVSAAFICTLLSVITFILMLYSKIRDDIAYDNKNINRLKKEENSLIEIHCEKIIKKYEL